MKKRLIIIHGYMATPDNHWFQWLKTEAEKLDMHVSVALLNNRESCCFDMPILVKNACNSCVILPILTLTC